MILDTQGAQISQKQDEHNGDNREGIYMITYICIYNDIYTCIFIYAHTYICIWVLKPFSNVLHYMYIYIYIYMYYICIFVYNKLIFQLIFPVLQKSSTSQLSSWRFDKNRNILQSENNTLSSWIYVYTLDSLKFLTKLSPILK